MAGVSLTHVAQNIIEIVPLWRFEADLPTIINSSNTSFSPPEITKIQKFSIGNHTITSEGENYANWVRNFPGASNVDNITITMLEDGNPTSPFSVTSYWLAWMDLIHDSSGNYGLPYQYYQPITLYPLNTYGNRIASIVAAECWPTNVSNFDYDGESSAALYVSITIACSRVTPTPIQT